MTLLKEQGAANGIGDQNMHDVIWPGASPTASSACARASGLRWRAGDLNDAVLKSIYGGEDWLH